MALPLSCVASGRWGQGSWVFGVVSGRGCAAPPAEPGLWVGSASGTGSRAGTRRGRAYQQVLLLELGNPVFALLLVFLDGLLDTLLEGVKLHFALLLLFQAVFKNVQADDDKFVLVGEWPLRKLAAALGAGCWEDAGRGRW